MAWNQLSDKDPHHRTPCKVPTYIQPQSHKMDGWKLELQPKLGKETFPSGLLCFHLNPVAPGAKSLMKGLDDTLAK